MTLSSEEYAAMALLGFDEVEAEAMTAVWSTPFVERLLTEDVVDLRDEGLPMVQVLEAVVHGLGPGEAAFASQHGFSMRDFHVICLATGPKANLSDWSAVFSRTRLGALPPRRFLIDVMLANKTPRDADLDLDAYDAASRGEQGVDGVMRSVDEVVAAVAVLAGLPQAARSDCGCTT